MKGPKVPLGQKLHGHGASSLSTISVEHKRTNNIHSTAINCQFGKVYFPIFFRANRCIKEFNIGQSVIKSASPTFALIGEGGRDQQSTFHNLCE